MSTVIAALLHPFVTLWRRSSASSWRRLPYPQDEPAAHASGPDADRILLCGGGIAVGYGVLSHELGLAGQLARRLTALTGRGVTVKVAASPEYSLSDVPWILDDYRAARFDAVVLAFGGSETATLATASAWRRTLDGVLARIHESDAPRFEIFVVGLPRLSAVPGAYLPLARLRATLFDAESRLACAQWPDVTFVPIDGGAPASGPLGKSSYNSWAEEIAHPMAGPLDALALVPVDDGPQDEVTRQAAVNNISELPEETILELERVLDSARNLFGTSGAAVTVIDGDVQRALASSGEVVDRIPREHSLCNVTIQSERALIVRDTLTDERFEDSREALASAGVRFYAGYPLEAPGGERVGALCLLDGEARTFSEADSTLLRELALRAQAILWGSPGQARHGVNGG